MHRLHAFGGKIQNGEASMAQRNARIRIGPDIAGIRSAMCQRLDHPAGDGA
jgi:uncharacterized protein (UPF0264 family)